MKESMILSALVLLVVPPPAAAEEGKKCTAEATVCVREMADGLRQRGWIGIEWEDEAGRPRITHVVPGSPAEGAGVRPGDVVMVFNGVSTDQGEEAVYSEVKRSLVPGKTITLEVDRGGARSELTVKLVQIPEHIVAQWVGKHVLEHHSAPAEEPPGGDP